ncbi:hypothetical protein EGW08_011944 [Elysia chlorotica]|uniref:Uncharacterized protein n=1 Tax=Elysia chlorotica TaxID=188477 RepID=A0A3S1B5E4_ELYCH|nr:hypothetical protein EGW08_011944 [Elysia chlorotica]
MKVFVATAILAAVLLAHTDAALVKRNVFTDAWKTLKEFEEQLVHTTFPKLYSMGQAGVKAIRDLAVELTEDALGAVKDEYQQIKASVNSTIHSDEFDEAVNNLIPLINNVYTAAGCTIVCEGSAFLTKNVVIEVVASSTCPLLCQGALAKLRHAAETLEATL